jgi:hypothetical protein
MSGRRKKSGILKGSSEWSVKTMIPVRNLGSELNKIKADRLGLSTQTASVSLRRSVFTNR